MRCQRQILCVCWRAHVSNSEVLQRSGLSTSYHWYILRHRRLSLFGHVARLDPGVPALWCSASDGGNTYTKAERQWPAAEDYRIALYSSTGFRRMPTLYCSLQLSMLWRSDIARGHGAAQRFTRTTRRRRWWWRMTCVKNGGYN